MSEHVHTVHTPFPIDAELASALANPMVIVVFDSFGRVVTRGDAALPREMVGLALAEFAAAVCADNPPSAEDIAEYEAGR